MAEYIPKPSVRGRQAKPRKIRMPPAWSGYQEKTAHLFRRLGCTAETNAIVDGARARHAVDVWVTFEHFGINHRWMVECKFWRTSVTKEKILVAQQVAADVGAEKVFVLSEAGFQSGAIRAAQHTNLTLTSLDDLRAVTKEELLSLALERSEVRLNGLDHRITALHRESDATSFRPDPGVTPGELTELMGHAFGLGLTIKKARLDDFPVVMHGGSKAPRVAKGVLEVVDQLEPMLTRLEQRLERLETKSWQGRAIETRLVDRVAVAVKGFLLAGEAAVLSGDTGQSREKLLLKALAAMRRLGHAAEIARPRLGATSGSALVRLMRALIDGPYLMLSEPGVRATAWADGQRRVEQVLGDFMNTTSPPRQP